MTFRKNESKIVNGICLKKLRKGNIKITGMPGDERYDSSSAGGRRSGEVVLKSEGDFGFYEYMNWLFSEVRGVCFHTLRSMQ